MCMSQLSEASSLEALLLGVAQDAGVPHIGCDCRTCALARREPRRRQLPVSLALIDHRAESSWVIDATPAFPEQLALLQEYAPRCRLAGVLLTHAHIGHYMGLMYLGREALNSRAVPVYASARLCAYLTANGPWSQLVALGNISLQTITPAVPIALSERLRVTPLPFRVQRYDGLPGARASAQPVLLPGYRSLGGVAGVIATCAGNRRRSAARRHILQL
jgi:pyrroloquinoline quinone biosynthesis protein B